MSRSLIRPAVLAALLVVLTSRPAAAGPPAERELTLAELRQFLARDLHDAESRRLEEAGKLDEAAAVAEKVVVIERALRPGSAELADALIRLGQLRSNLENYAAADKARREALELNTRRLGADHPDVASLRKEVAVGERLARATAAEKARFLAAFKSYQTVGTLLEEKKIPEAVRSYEEALAGFKEVVGERHELYGVALAYGGTVYVAAGRPERAAEVLRAGLKLLEDVLGRVAVARDVPDRLAELFGEIAEARARKGEWTEARKLRAEALELLRKYRGDKHALTVEARLALEQTARAEKLAPDLQKALLEADRLVDQFGEAREDDPQKALGLIRQALPLYKAALGADSLAHADAVNYEGLMLAKQKDHAAAADRYRAAVVVSDRLRGPDHPEAVVRQDNLTGALYDLAEAARKAGDVEAARKCYAEIVALRTRLHGKDDWRTARARTHLEHAARLADLPEDQRGKALAALRVVADNFSLNGPEEVLAARPKVVEAEAVLRSLLGPNDRGVLKAADLLGGMATTARDFDEAERRFRACEAGWAGLVGKEHPEYSYALQRLAMLYRMKGDRSKPEALLREALRISKATVGEEDAQYLFQCSELAAVLSDTFAYEESARLYREAMEGYRRLYGSKSGRYQFVLRKYAVTLRLAGNLDGAAVRFQEVLELLKEAGKDKTDDYANNLNSLGVIELTRGNFAEADRRLTEALTVLLPLPRQEVEFMLMMVGQNLAVARLRLGKEADARQLVGVLVADREKALGADSLEFADFLNRLGTAFFTLGGAEVTAFASKPALDLAEPLLRRALEIRVKADGADSAAAAEGLHSLGVVYRLRADHVRAVDHFGRALALQERLLGPDHRLTLGSVNSLGVTLREAGDLPRAEPLLRRGLEAHRKPPGRQGAPLALALLNLGGVYSGMGDYARAEPLLREGLEVTRSALGERHARTAAAFGVLANLYRATGDRERAELFALRAIDGFRAAKGEQSPEYAGALLTLVRLHLAAGRPDEALAPARKAVAVLDKTAAGQEGVVSSRTFLALAHLPRGELAEARDVLDEALARARELFGEGHPAYAAVLPAVAALEERRGEPAKAAATLARALAAAEKQLDLGAAGQSERQQIAAAEQLRWQLDRFLSAAGRAGLSAEETYAHVLTWKGATFARQRRQRAFRAAGDAETAALAGKLEESSRQLGALVNFPPAAAADRAAWRRQLQELTDEKERLEKELARRSAAFRAQQEHERPTVAALKALLPKDAALVDFFEYTAAEFPPGGKGALRQERRLAAFVVRAGRPVVRVELGPVRAIADNVDTWRASLRRRGTGGTDDPAAALRRTVWLPLREHLGGAATVVLSPDGAVSRLPFAALPGEKEQTYLLEEVALAVLPVPQLLSEVLAERPRRAPEAPTLLLLGDADFDLDAQPQVADATQWAMTRGRSERWQRLPGTRAELESLHQAFGTHFPRGRVDTLRGGEATEANVRTLAPKARWLHLATHGFFAPPAAGAALASGEGVFGAGGVGGFHPGLLSGLVLAGANHPPQPGRDDGILTALEVADLDLSGVELAVLSACETGLGKVSGGEGVLGLQRAFQAAGAQTVVTTLWQIPDEPTKVLMERFYENLWVRKMTRLAALGEAQRWMLKEGRTRPGIARGLEREDAPQPAKDGRLPPYYWAAFVLSGDWR